MIKIDKVSVMNLENAVRGARNPMNSWGKSDSCFCEGHPSECQAYIDGRNCLYDTYKESGMFLGENDLTLLTKLCKSGSDHRKFMRQIFVSMDIVAPLYFWKEFDTYKVGTTANSCSTMHKIHTKEFVFEDFSCDMMDSHTEDCMSAVIDTLEGLRNEFLETKNKKYWYSMIQLLPSSYNQTRTVTMTYENLINMYNNRKNHKLDEWREFCEVVKGLPYAEQLICFEK